MMRRRVGRPGLAGTMARTAVVAGTATAVAGGVSRRQTRRAQGKADAQQDQIDQAAAEQNAQQQAEWEAQQQWAAQQQPLPPPPPDTNELVERLTALAGLRDQGVLTDAEFEVQKAKLLNA